MVLIRRLYILILFGSMLFFISACGEFETTQSLSLSSAKNEAPVPQDDPPPPATPNSKRIDFCSELNLNDIKWPTNLSALEIDIFALAMNITSTFEGREKWGNLSNNFDGQGVSLGLFQQNLGQGSLQELMISTYEKYPELFDTHFSVSQKNSLLAMLNEWSDDQILSRNISSNEFSNPSTKSNSTISDFSKLDKLSFSAKSTVSRNDISVDWAVNTLFLTDKKTFKPDWKKALKSFATDPIYISMQVLAADQINQKATRLFNEYNTHQLGSYLFFFDIVVQNGGIPPRIKLLYSNEIKNKSNLNEVEKMKILLKHRLTISRPEYVEDVRSRKVAILDGQGIVHQTQRNFPKEFCLDQWFQSIK